MNARSRVERRAGLGRVAVALALVLGLAAPLASAADQPVIFGTSIPLNGAIPSGEPGQRVDVLARTYGAKTFGRIATVTTKSGGRWTYAARPTIRTTYVATTSGTMTSTVDIHVAPRLDLDLRRGMLTVSARALRPLSGRYVLVQVRRARGAWHGVRKIVLGQGSRTQTPFAAPQGRSEIRLFMPASQAGAGYDGGFSGILAFRNTA